MPKKIQKKVIQKKVQIKNSAKNVWLVARKSLLTDGVVVLPVDTELYGLIALAASKPAVEKVYKIKGRDDGKPCIVLFTSWDELKQFGVMITPEIKNRLNTLWPGMVSVVLPVKPTKRSYLDRGSKTLAFRMVSKKHAKLFALLSATGPLIAPSANPQGLPPAATLTEAKQYFGEKVDVYVAGGKRNGKPSTLIRILENKPIVLRQGHVKIR